MRRPYLLVSPTQWQLNSSILDTLTKNDLSKAIADFVASETYIQYMEIPQQNTETKYKYSTDMLGEAHRQKQKPDELVESMLASYGFLNQEVGFLKDKYQEILKKSHELWEAFSLFRGSLERPLALDQLEEFDKDGKFLDLLKNQQELENLRDLLIFKFSQAKLAVYQKEPVSSRDDKDIKIKVDQSLIELLSIDPDIKSIDKESLNKAVADLKFLKSKLSGKFGVDYSIQQIRDGYNLTIGHLKWIEQQKLALVEEFDYIAYILQRINQVLEKIHELDPKGNLFEIFSQLEKINIPLVKKVINSESESPVYQFFLKELNKALVFVNNFERILKFFEVKLNKKSEILTSLNTLLNLSRFKQSTQSDEIMSKAKLEIDYKEYKTDDALNWFRDVNQFSAFFRYILQKSPREVRQKIISYTPAFQIEKNFSIESLMKSPIINLMYYFRVIEKTAFEWTQYIAGAQLALKSMVPDHEFIVFTTSSEAKQQFHKILTVNYVNSLIKEAKNLGYHHPFIDLLVEIHFSAVTCKQIAVTIEEKRKKNSSFENTDKTSREQTRQCLSGFDIVQVENIVKLKTLTHFLLEKLNQISKGYSQDIENLKKILNESQSGIQYFEELVSRHYSSDLHVEWKKWEEMIKKERVKAFSEPEEQQIQRRAELRSKRQSISTVSSSRPEQQESSIAPLAEPIEVKPPTSVVVRPSPSLYTSPSQSDTPARTATVVTPDAPLAPPPLLSARLTVFSEKQNRRAGSSDSDSVVSAPSS